MSRWARAAIAALLTLPAIAPGAIAAEPQTNLADIEDEVMCPICGTTLELSESPQAEQEKDFIRARVDEGLTKDEIKDALVAEYGEDVLATPDSDGFDLTAWVVPIAGILVAVLGVGLAIARLRGRGGDEPKPALDAADDARLERDMEAYDL